jgi:hypothetical protein
MLLLHGPSTYHGGLGREYIPTKVGLVIRLFYVAVLETQREYYVRVGPGLSDSGARFGGWV